MVMGSRSYHRHQVRKETKSLEHHKITCRFILDTFWEDLKQDRFSFLLHAVLSISLDFVVKGENGANA